MILQGNALYIPLADESVQCIVTSPPYWGLRAYGTQLQVWGGEATCEHVWVDNACGRRSNDGGARDRLQTDNIGSLGREQPVHNAFCAKCGAWQGELGLEPTTQLFVEHLVAVFRECRRVLRKDGVLWLNLGDSYLSATDGRNGNNLKPKDLVGIPWRVAFALQDDGWWLRSDIIWAKTNPMPESVRDRPTRAHEYIFMLTKRARYYWNKEGAREPAVTGKWEAMPPIGDVKHLDNGNRTYSGNCPPGNGNRNMRDVWTMNTGRYRGAHFATFPEILAKKCIMASTRAGDMVFDPFGGTGTTVATAIALGRRGTMLEINKDYCELAQQRLARAQPGMW